MAKKVEFRVFRPRSLSGLLRLYSKNPEALVFAGGTEIMPRAVQGKDRGAALQEKVLYIGNIQELSRLSRSQRYLDIGSCLPISRILSIGRHILPRVIFEALRSIGNPAVRNLATLGGNICSPLPFNDSLSALNVIDAQLEFRSLNQTRWLAVGQFFSDTEESILKPGEILVRIRVPLEDWDFQVFRKVGRRQSQSRSIVNFSGAARFAKGVLECFRFSIAGVGSKVFRSREIEARLEGGRLPVSAKEINALLSDLAEKLRASTDGYSTAEYRKATALRLLKWYIDSLNKKSQGILSGG